MPRALAMPLLTAPSTLTTRRLVGERIGPHHLADLRRLHRDPRVAVTLSANGRPLPAAVTAYWLDRFQSHWGRHGFGTWMFRRRLDDRFVGYGGLHRTTAGGAAGVELLYAVDSRYWRAGLATEMSRAVLDVGFGVLGLSVVVGLTLPGNRGSRGVMRKLGFRDAGEVIHADLPHVRYRLVSPSAAGETRSASLHG